MCYELFRKSIKFKFVPEPPRNCKFGHALLKVSIGLIYPYFNVSLDLAQIDRKFDKMGLFA